MGQATRQKIWAVRKGTDFRDRARAIQNKHGSRKSGVPMRGRRAVNSQSSKQLSLSLNLEQKP